MILPIRQPGQPRINSRLCTWVISGAIEHIMPLLSPRGRRAPAKKGSMDHQLLEEVRNLLETEGDF